jgi:hypothetical protein
MPSPPTTMRRSAGVGHRPKTAKLIVVQLAGKIAGAAAGSSSTPIDAAVVARSCRRSSARLVRARRERGARVRRGRRGEATALGAGAPAPDLAALGPARKEPSVDELRDAGEPGREPSSRSRARCARRRSRSSSAAEGARQLQLLLDAARIQQRPADHILLSGRPGSARRRSR